MDKTNKRWVKATTELIESGHTGLYLHPHHRKVTVLFPPFDSRYGKHGDGVTEENPVGMWVTAEDLENFMNDTGFKPSNHEFLELVFEHLNVTMIHNRRTRDKRNEYDKAVILEDNRMIIGNYQILFAQ